MRIALSLFCSWLRSSWQLTTRPVGLCVIRTAESVVFTDWPPGPLDRNTSISRSFGSISTSTSSASGSTATVAALVWIRPWLSVSGTRCTRCGPPSYFSRDHASSPFTTNETSRNPPCRTAGSTAPRASSRASRRSAGTCGTGRRPRGCASSPPSVPWITTMTFLPSFGIAREQQLLELRPRAVEPRFLGRRAHLRGSRASRRRPRRRASCGRRRARLRGAGTRRTPRRPASARRAGARRRASAAPVTGGVDLRQLRLELFELGFEIRRADRT